MEKQERKLSGYVGRKIADMQHLRESAARAQLARLRRAVGKAPGSVPDVWAITLDGLPEEMLSKTGKPTKEEVAVHTAITLYALHQQGKPLSERLMHAQGQTLGAAARRLAAIRRQETGATTDEGTDRRFLAAATAQSVEEFTHHLRGLITQMRAENISLDYGQLAEDLFQFQFPAGRDRVRLRWGQDYYRLNVAEDKSEEENHG